MAPAAAAEVAATEVAATVVRTAPAAEEGSAQWGLLPQQGLQACLVLSHWLPE